MKIVGVRRQKQPPPRAPDPTRRRRPCRYRQGQDMLLWLHMSRHADRDDGCLC